METSTSETDAIKAPTGQLDEKTIVQISSRKEKKSIEGKVKRVGQNKTTVKVDSLIAGVMDGGDLVELTAIRKPRATITQAYINSVIDAAIRPISEQIENIIRRLNSMETENVREVGYSKSRVLL